MHRRDFVKLAGLTGITLMLPWTGSTARADQTTWGGPYFLQMHAGGGWDPTLLCDGKLTAAGPTPVYENKLVTAVTPINGIPVPSASATGKFFYKDDTSLIEDPAHFFQTAGSDFLVFNGVDTQTNNHDTGVQCLACGHNDVELPALAALFAGMAAKGRDVPMAFLAGGQYNRTGDVVGVSRFPGDKVALLADPFKATPTDEKGLLSDLATQRIIQLRNERFDKLSREATLPRNKRTLLALRDASRGGAAVNLLKQVASAPAPGIDTFLNDLAPETRAYLGAPQNVGGKPRFLDFGAPLETVLQCFKAGVSAAATFDQGGFDTHSNHDVNQQESMGIFVARLRYVLLRAAQLGLKDKLYVLVTSDFGRTPRYNSGNGKEHWNVTSTLLAGPGIRGGRVLGKSDEGHKALRVAIDDPSKALPDNDNNGQRIKASDIHRELRRVLGVDKADFIKEFPLPAGAPLPLLA
jgi:hypothetical protein